MTARLTLVLTALTVMAVALLASATASAQDTGPLTVDRQSVAAGDTVTFSGSGCVAGAQVEYRVLRGDINAPEIELLGDTEADADGNFSTSVTIPAGTTAGSLEITARCGNSPTSSQTLSAQITVTTGELAVTGSATAVLALAGGLAILAGVTLLTLRPAKLR